MRSRTEMKDRKEATFHTPWGEGTVVLDGDALARIDLPVPRGLLPSALVPPAPDCTPSPSAAEDPLDRWVRELEAYFRGGRRQWKLAELDLDALPVGDFARAVYRALLTVPPGETVSYGELATMAGHPRAARAVGSAMAANPLPLVIPCHRVVRADGSPGRYGDCDALKPYLLSLEGAW
jgi:methylated-DNA-[protein]-cysteine S-methyltransferase